MREKARDFEASCRGEAGCLLQLHPVCAACVCVCVRKRERGIFNLFFFQGKSDPL